MVIEDEGERAGKARMKRAESYAKASPVHLRLRMHKCTTSEAPLPPTFKTQLLWVAFKRKINICFNQIFL